MKAKKTTMEGAWDLIHGISKKGSKLIAVIEEIISGCSRLLGLVYFVEILCFIVRCLGSYSGYVIGDSNRLL